MPFDPKSLAQFPTLPGIYIMRAKNGNVLYVGKAKQIRSRLKQYFQKGGDGRYMIPFLIAKVDHIETIVTQSEKEALVLENNLIKQHRPRYNVLFRDDKSYICLSIDKNQLWPTVRIRRAHNAKKKKGEELFGPYPNPFAARAALDEIYRYFQLRQCSDRELMSRTRPCILHGMGRCPAPCTDQISSEAYKEKVGQAIAFLKGERSDLIHYLKGEMEKASKKLEFERAGALLKQIKGLESVRGPSSQVENTKLGNCDIIGVWREGDALCITTLLVRGSKLSGSQESIFENCLSSTPDALEHYLMQRLTDTLHYPDEVILPELTSSPQMLMEYIEQQSHTKIRITIPQKGIKKKLLELAHQNAKANFEKRKQESAEAENVQLLLAEALHIDPPSRIECIDQSHLAGSGMVSAVVTFRQGKKHKAGYRRYALRDAAPGDDTGALKEALRRHYKDAGPSTLPDLLVVDGGRGQVNAAAEVLRELDISTIDLIGLAKEKSRHDKGLSQEAIFLPEEKEPIYLDRQSPALFFLQLVRDETHRFVITYQKKKRSEGVSRSALDEIEGIGPKKKAALLRHFGSVSNIRQANLDELSHISGISPKDAERLIQFFQ